MKKDKRKGNWADIVEVRRRTTHNTLDLIYTDGSKEPKEGKTGFAFVIPELNVNSMTVYTVEMLAITMA